MRLRHLLLLAIIVLAAPAVSSAQTWVTKMFPEVEYDFDTVARGADAVHRFEIKNIYKQEMNVVNVRSSCGCTTPSIDKNQLKTGEVGHIIASFNTRTFTGVHSATLTVEVEWNDQGTIRRGEAQLHVYGNIRGDVVFEPGAVKFDSVDQGTVVEKTVRVTYAGRDNWEIVDVRGASTDFEVELTQRQRAQRRVAYDLLIRLKDTVEPGYINEQLVLVTNDDRNPRIPLGVEGRVISALSISPAPLVMGEVEPGQVVSKRIIVRGKQPFRITSIDCGRDCFQFDVDDKSSTRHVVEVSFSASDELGPVEESIQITTDMGASMRAKLTAYATVVPSEAAAVETQTSDANDEAEVIPASMTSG